LPEEDREEQVPNNFGIATKEGHREEEGPSRHKTGHGSMETRGETGEESEPPKTSQTGPAGFYEFHEQKKAVRNRG
jgi:hypothetical protein